MVKKFSEVPQAKVGRQKCLVRHLPTFTGKLLIRMMLPEAAEESATDGLICSWNMVEENRSTPESSLFSSGVPPAPSTDKA